MMTELKKIIKFYMTHPNPSAFGISPKGRIALSRMDSRELFF